MKSIDAVIAVKNRDNERVKRCINSFKKHVDNIYVVDYGSDIPIKVDDAEIIRYDGCPVWNKSHALNLGIKKSMADYIMTVDCDMLLNDGIMKKIKSNLSEKTCIFNTNVRRIDLSKISDNWTEMISYSFPWFPNNPRGNVYSAANGGIQVTPREWLYKIGGYDEGLGVYWGAMDNRIYEQAKMDGMTVIDLNIPMLHQEHRNKKEDNLNEEEREFANKVRAYKIYFLRNLVDLNVVISTRPWGGDYPNHDWLLDEVREWDGKVTEQREKLDEMFIYIAIINNHREVPAYLAIDLANITKKLTEAKIKHTIQAIRAPAVDSIRNYNVLNAKEMGCTHIVMLDSDHRYAADFILKLIKHNKEFVCGATCQKNPPYFPTQYKEIKEIMKETDNLAYPTGKELIKIEGSGMVGALIDLNIFDRIDFPYYKRDYDLVDGKVRETGEDIYFCRKIKDKVEMYLDPTISFPHEVINTFADRSHIKYFGN